MDNTFSPTAFSAQRFVTLAKTDFIINKTNYLRTLLSLLGVFVVIAIFQSIYAAMSDSGYRQVAYGSSYLFISAWVISLAMTLLGSLTFSNLSSKRSRIDAFMIPASRIEKFALRVIVYDVFGTVLLIIGFLTGALICQISFGAWSAIFNEIKSLFEMDYGWYISGYAVLAALLGNSLYALGSALWPKLSWVKTWVVISVAQWVFFTLMIILFSQDFNWHDLFNSLVDNIQTLFWIGIVIIFLLIILCWIFTWKRYRNIQIIQRFMTK